MIINGEKFACETCIRGHRTTQCQHFDRPLQQIGGKGRPVSQCNHCRTLRQHYSVHTKCTCATAARRGTIDTTITRRCACFEGGSCTCAFSQRGSSPNSVSQRSPSLQASPSLHVSPGLNADASLPTNPQGLDQAGFTQTLPAQPEPSQPQQAQQPQLGGMSSLGPMLDFSQLDGWNYDGSLGAWGIPTPHNTAFDDTAAMMLLDAMSMPDLTQGPTAAWPIHGQLPTTQPPGETWSWADGGGSSGQGSHHEHGSRDW